MAFNTFPESARVGAWRVSARAGRLARAGVERTVEPKVMDLLVLLASRPGEVITREEIVSALWPETIVVDDTLARVVFKLRKAFDDDAKTPAYVETISKRGYRLIAEVDLAAAAVMPARRWRQSALALALVLAGAAFLAIGIWGIAGAPSETATLIARAKDYYFQYTRADNEAAIELYERVLDAEPDHAEAQAGLATALVQRVLRWPNPPGGLDFTRTTLGEALASGRTETASAGMVEPCARA